MSNNRPHSLLYIVGLALVVLLPLLVTASPANAQEGRPTRKSRADQSFDTDFQNLQQRQDQYKQRNGKYWQGLPTHGKPVAEELTYPDQWFNVPTDQRGQPWARMISFERRAYSLRVDVYSGPDGDGWVMCALIVDENGETLERCQGDGPEWRDTDWQPVKVEVEP